MSWIKNLSDNLIVNANLYLDNKNNTDIKLPIPQKNHTIIQHITTPIIQIKKAKNKIVKNYNISWNLTASIDGIDFTQNYSCYDDECLESTFFIDEILDFANEQGFTKIGYKHPKVNEFNIIIDCDINEFIKKIQNFIKFKTGRFITNSITRLDCNSELYNATDVIKN